MCGLIFDAMAIFGLVSMLNEGDEPEFFKAFLVGAGLAAATYAASLGLASVHPLAVLGIIPVVAIAAGVTLFAIFEVPPVKAAIGGVVFMVYKIGLAIALAFMMGI